MSLVKQSYDNGTFTEDVKKKLQDINYDVEENNTDITVNLDKLFELSITHKSIEVWIIGPNKSFVNQSFIRPHPDSSLINHYIVTENPIISFAVKDKFDSQGSICFTYFNALKQYWNKYRMDLKFIKIVIRNNFMSYPPILSYRNYQVSFHSPNIMQKVSANFIKSIL